MSITLTRTGIAVAVAAGLVIVGAAGTVSYAAGSSASGVTACANGKGRLALASSKNKCAKGYKKVTIAKQGPRGATGAPGVAGQQGQRGPGIVTYRQVSFFDSTGTSVVAGGHTWSSTCSVTGTGNARVVKATLTVAAPSGKTVALDGLTFAGPDNAQSATVVDTPRAATASVQELANSQQSGTTRSTSLLVLGNDGNQLVTFSIYVNSADASQFVPFPTRCSIDAVITPAS